MAALKPHLVESKLRQFSGNMAAVARAFNVTRQSVRRYIARHPDLGEVKEECRETMLDVAESSLYRAVKDGEAWAVCFFLKTQGKKRGYIERQDVNFSGETATRLIITEEIVDHADLGKNGQAAPESTSVPPE